MCIERGIMITSTSNPKVKYIAQLQKKRRLREEKGVFLIEGIRMFKETPRELILETYISESFYTKNKALIQEYGKHVEIVTDTVFQKISETKTPQGVLCVLKRKEYKLEELLSDENANLIILDGLQDPGNVGTILRTAEASGVTGLIISADTADLYQSKTIRSTMGSIFRVPVVFVDNVGIVLKILKKHEITIFATHLAGEKWYNEIDYKKKSAFLIGNEGNGLKQEIAELADEWIKIPMSGEVESLNAAIATSILMYEVYNQRR